VSLFDHPMSGTTFFAVAFGFLAAGMTVVGAMIPILAGALVGFFLAQLVVLAQLAAAGLLVAGGVRMVRGRGNGLLVAGAVLDLAVCGAYAAHFVAEGEPELVFAPIGFAGVILTSLVLAVTPWARFTHRG
jgi:hypothetical protein